MIDPSAIQQLIDSTLPPETVELDGILSKARELNGLTTGEAMKLLSVTSEADRLRLFETAKYVKNEIYGNRLVIFAPLYASNYCHNECLYCAFRTSNDDLPRKALSKDELVIETKALLRQGQKRVLLVSGETYPEGKGVGYIYDAIGAVYQTSSEYGAIRRINVNIAPLTVDEFKGLKACDIGTYQLFQETYHKETYQTMHPSGKKSDYDWRLKVMDRALDAGIEDIGIGILYGLYDWKYETLAMLEHCQSLEDRYGVGPHTISVPRLEPADHSPISLHPPYKVDDLTFQTIIAVLRMAVPYTGIILSTRESPAMRRAAFDLGVSQISAGSKTSPGGYGSNSSSAEQFSLGDHRSLDLVIKDMLQAGYVPSFCTSCYRSGRVGKDFMDLAKPGLIRKHCLPNALYSLAEYLEDFADTSTTDEGYALIQKMIGLEVPIALRNFVTKRLEAIQAGGRDIYQ